MTNAYINRVVILGMKVATEYSYDGSRNPAVEKDPVVKLHIHRAGIKSTKVESNAKNFGP